jgi:tryptophan synthase alpha chain
MSRTIAESLKAARAAGGIALIPFLPAGYPDLETTTACISSLERAGASVIEIGFPFSDPIADGPAIQEAFTHALEHGVRVRQVIESVRSIRDRVSIPLVAMLSYSVVYKYGVAKFVNDVRDAGFSGLILPDLPPPEAEAICKVVRSAALDTILLVAPTTPRARRAQIAKLCSGFVYYLSVAGITGERSELPPQIVENVRELQALTEVPICVGFGIHQRRQLQTQPGAIANVFGMLIESPLVAPPFEWFPWRRPSRVAIRKASPGRSRTSSLRRNASCASVSLA